MYYRQPTLQEFLIILIGKFAMGIFNLFLFQFIYLFLFCQFIYFYVLLV